MLNRNQPNFFSLAMKAKQKGDFRKAIDLFKQCPMSFEIFFQLGQCFRKMKDYEGALLSFHDARNENKKDFKDELKIHEQICDTYSMYYLEKENKKLLERFKGAIDDHPVQTSSVVQYYMALYHFYSDQVLEAKQIIKKLKEENSHDANLMFRLCKLDADMCEYLGEEFSKNDAEELIKYAQLATIPNVMALLSMAQNYSIRVDLNKINLNVSYSLQEQRAVAELQMMSNSSLGFKSYEKLVKRFPDDWKTRRSYAHHLENLGNEQEAIDVLEPYVLSARNKLDNKKLLNSYKFLASTYFNLDNTIKAKKYINLGLDIEPEDASLHSILGKINPAYSSTSCRNFAIARQDKARTERLHPGSKSQESKVTIESKEKSSPIIANKTPETISTAKPQIGYKLAENQNMNFFKKPTGSNAKNAKTKVFDYKLLEDPFEYDISSSKPNG